MDHKIVSCAVSPPYRGCPSQSRIWKHADNLFRTDGDPVTGSVPTPVVLGGHGVPHSLRDGIRSGQHSGSTV